jgi:hypothetical protein
LRTIPVRSGLKLWGWRGGRLAHEPTPPVPRRNKTPKLCKSLAHPAHSRNTTIPSSFTPGTGEILGRGVEEPGTSSRLEEDRNLSLASILVVLEEVMKHRRPATGTLGLIAAMGPGFCSELLLPQW